MQGNVALSKRVTHWIAIPDNPPNREGIHIRP